MKLVPVNKEVKAGYVEAKKDPVAQKYVSKDPAKKVDSDSVDWQNGIKAKNVDLTHVKVVKKDQAADVKQEPSKNVSNSYKKVEVAPSKEVHEQKSVKYVEASAKDEK